MSKRWRRCDVDGRAFKGVREKRDHGERSLERALSALASALNGVGTPWMVIGGMAVIARGVRRMTTDIDAVVPGDAMPMEGLLRAFKKFHILPRIKDAKAFAQANLVLLLRHAPTGADLDVSLAWTSFELEALEGREMARYGRVLAPMATPRT